MNATGSKREKCEDCRYFNPGEERNQAKCCRFARFVDHVITEYTKDCEYWAPVEYDGARA